MIDSLSGQPEPGEPDFILSVYGPAFLAAGWLPPDSPPITPEVRLHASPAEVAYGLACDDRDIWKARAEAAGWRPPDE